VQEMKNTLKPQGEKQKLARADHGGMTKSQLKE